MNLDINEVLAIAKETVAEKEYDIWLLKAQIKKLEEHIFELTKKELEEDK